MSLTLATSGDNASILWNRTTDDSSANLTRRRVKLINIMTSPPEAGIVVIIGDPSTHPDAKIVTITMFVNPKSDSLAVASVGVVLEEMIGYSSSNPLMCALIITGAHYDTIVSYIKKLGRRCGPNTFFMRGPNSSYNHGETEAALGEVTRNLESQLGTPLIITWNIAQGCPV